MKKVLLSSLEKIEYSQYFQSFVYFSSSTDIHTLSNIHILTYGISGATGAEVASVRHWWDITISATRPIIKLIHVLSTFHVRMCNYRVSCLMLSQNLNNYRNGAAMRSHNVPRANFKFT